MIVHLESTTQITTVDGVRCRVWQGQTANGIPMHAYIALVAVAREQDAAEFERELQEHATPRADVAEIADIPLRRVD